MLATQSVAGRHLLFVVVVIVVVVVVSGTIVVVWLAGPLLVASVFLGVLLLLTRHRLPICGASSTRVIFARRLRLAIGSFLHLWSFAGRRSSSGLNSRGCRSAADALGIPLALHVANQPRSTLEPASACTPLLHLACRRRSAANALRIPLALHVALQPRRALEPASARTPFLYERRVDGGLSERNSWVLLVGSIIIRDLNRAILVSSSLTRHRGAPLLGSRLERRGRAAEAGLQSGLGCRGESRLSRWRQSGLVGRYC